MSTEDIIIKKLSSIEYLDPKYVINELSKLDTVKEKVTLIKEINTNHYDKYSEALKTLNEEEQDYYYQNRNSFQKRFFGSNLIDGYLVLQEPVYEKFFKPIKDSAEYKHEINLYYAEVQFQKLITSQKFIDELNSDLRNNHIEKRLKELNERSNKSLRLYSEGKFDKNKFTWTDLELYEYIEIFRVLNGDYDKKNLQPLSENYVWVAMMDYHFIKPYLEEQYSISKLQNATNDNYTAKHHALAYIFDLYSKGRCLPISDGGLNKKELERIGRERKSDKTGNGFYKAVYYISKEIDLNSRKDLETISLDWKKIVLSLTNNDKEVIKYIQDKGL